MASQLTFGSLSPTYACFTLARCADTLRLASSGPAALMRFALPCAAILPLMLEAGAAGMTYISQVCIAYQPLVKFRLMHRVHHDAERAAVIHHSAERAAVSSCSGHCIA